MIKKLFIISSAFVLLFAAGVRTGHAQTDQASAAYPVRLIIPSIGLSANIQQMGLTSKGDLAVPSGATKNVGWYKDGTVPGEIGSAVMDAHVFAAFSKLKYVKPGAAVYVITNRNDVLHFTVAAREVNPLNRISADQLFNLDDKRRLNLITCAGTYIPKLGTYDHRLILHTVLQSKTAFVGTGGAS